MHDVITVTLNPAIDRTAIVPGFIAGEVNRASSAHDQPGGKGVNVAVALARASGGGGGVSGGGLRVAATGFLGADNRTAFDAFFQNTGIHNLFLPLPGSTRLGIKIVDPVNASTTDLNFPGLAPSPADLAALTDLLLQTSTTSAAATTPDSGPAADSAATPVAARAPFYVLAGSLPPLPPGMPASIYADWTRALRARGARVALDTSGEALAQALPASPTFIKPNVAELSALLGHAISDTDVNVVVAAARALIARHAMELVVVSMGAAGACFVTAREALHARPPAIAVQSTVGAGDAMVAGIVHAMLASEEIPALDDIARLATAFSVSALARPDSAAAFRDGIARHLPHVTIRPVAVG
ncbi:1-phosphofructokinase family hexose kinase [Opitutaceae bacterium TAV4]|nr:1-phosphofructokinase family hexose kinase [Opitutaceae bacterium TAV4]RRJ99171.1 1-phosphofructokinase family hexose kinase [Opitutaceae bacterium TAV3]